MPQSPAQPSEPRPHEQVVLGWLGEQQEAMVKLLAEVVGIDSGSYNKEGVDNVAARFARFFAEHDIAATVTPGDRQGSIVRAEIGAERGANAPILLMGHQDTVFPEGEAARRPFRIDNGRAYGPGVADMKAGLVMHAFVMAAFQRFGGAGLPVVALFTCDEEIGSPYSRKFIEAEARSARIALNAEPGRPSGNVVTGRKGGVFMRCEVFGKAAHSGSSFADGASAISELAHKIIALDKLTDLPKGITLNVGLINGGQSVNTSAPYAEGAVDLRFLNAQDRDAVMSRIEPIIETSTIAGTSAKLIVTGEFPPLIPSPESQELLAHYQAAAGSLGLKVEGEFTGACADSGFSAMVGTPTLCGVGPVGGKVHTPEEYLEVDSLVPRAQAVALTIARLAGQS